MNERRDPPGIERLIRKYVAIFRTPENLNHYAPEDLEKAEKRFVKHCLKEGPHVD